MECGASFRLIAIVGVCVYGESVLLLMMSEFRGHSKFKYMVQILISIHAKFYKTFRTVALAKLYTQDS